MTCNADFKKNILLKCCDALESIGFTRYRKLGVDYPIHDGFHCWIGLNSALYPDRVEIIPNVGLHAVSINKMKSRLDKSAPKYDRGVASYAISLGYLDGAADERAFAFSTEQSDSFIDSECKRLASLYITVGLEYAKSIANYKALAPLLYQRVMSLGGYPQSYAACLYFMGGKSRGNAVFN